MERITLVPVMHRGAEQVLIRCANEKRFNHAIREIRAVKWSNTHKAWYLPFSEESIQLICDTLKSISPIDTSRADQYLSKKKLVKATEVLEVEPDRAKDIERNDKIEALTVPYKQPQPSAIYKLSLENLQSLEQTVRLLSLKAYSSSTIKTYRAELLIFFQVLGKFPATKLTTEDVKRWLLKCLQEGLKENTMHSRINALKFFF